MSKLTFVVSTTHPWPFVEGCLRILAPQAERLKATIVLGDSTGRGLPDPMPDWMGRLVWLRLPGASVFELRARATEAAEGEIVAWTEDHCRPAADWGEKILAAAERHPQAEAIAGAVANGSVESTIDWANFLLTFAPLAPPIGAAGASRAPAVANVAYRKAALPDRKLATGEVELRLNRQLRERGKIVFDSGILVHHVQSHGKRGTFASHFHNGRSTTGLAAPMMSAGERAFRFLFCFVQPLEILRTVILGAGGKRGFRLPLLRSLPVIAALSIAHSAGELTGLVMNGAGESPFRLE
jgi:hypothetical protein